MAKVKKMAFGGLGGAVQRKPIGPPTSLPSRPNQSIERKPIGPATPMQPNPGRITGISGNIARPSYSPVERKPIGAVTKLPLTPGQSVERKPIGPATGTMTGMLGMKKGGMTASKRADGIASKGKTKGRML